MRTQGISESVCMGVI